MELTAVSIHGFTGHRLMLFTEFIVPVQLGARVYLWPFTGFNSRPFIPGLKAMDAWVGLLCFGPY